MRGKLTKKENNMSFFIEEENAVLIDRKITYKSGRVKKKLNLKYVNVDIDTASELLDDHAEEIEKAEDDERKTNTERTQDKRNWVINSIIDNDLLKEWDVYMKGEKKPVNIDKKTLEAVLKNGQLFNPIYQDFMDLLFKITNGVSLTEASNILKNSTKSAEPGRNTT